MFFYFFKFTQTKNFPNGFNRNKKCVPIITLKTFLQENEFQKQISILIKLLIKINLLK